MNKDNNLSYKSAGVDIDAGEEAVRRIKVHTKRTHGPEVLTNIGGFGGLFRFNANEYAEPVLVSSADGVGTKLKVAFLADRHDTIGQDLVNHCVDDILTTGAMPLFFLDYFAVSNLDPVVFEQVVEGLSLACEQNGCALIGGETAEMPDFYNPGEYDISGTIVGAADRGGLLPRNIATGDILIGIPSTGLHTNGYSLARAALLKEWKVETHLPELGTTVGDALLQIHRSYLKLSKPLLDKPWLKGFSHITGGGIVGNTNRLLPEGNELAIDWDAWEWPAIFNVIQSAGKVEVEDMRRTFNLGIGWLIVISPDGLAQLEEYLTSFGEDYYFVGEIK